MHIVRTGTSIYGITVTSLEVVDDCIKKDILKEFLRKQKAEVMKVSLYEYDAAKHDRSVLNEGIELGKKEGIKEGIKEGMQQGKQDLTIALVRKKLEKGQSIEQIAEALEETPAYIMQIKENLDK